MRALALSLSRNLYTRYIGASVGALAVDLSIFSLLMLAGLLPAAASAVGYVGGIAAHWLLSSRAVFTQSLAERGSGRNRQKALFMGSALVGLAITTAIVGLGDIMGLEPHLAKIVAIGVSFQATYMLRKRIVFL